MLARVDSSTTCPVFSCMLGVGFQGCQSQIGMRAGVAGTGAGGKGTQHQLLLVFLVFALRREFE